MIKMLDTFMETVTRWTLICIFVSLWALGITLVWKWFIGALQHMIHYILPQKRGDKKCTISCRKP